MNDRRLYVLTGLLFFLTLAIAPPVRADFNAVVRAIESRYGVRQTWIPFFGLARLAVRISHPHGVDDVQLATFEHARFGDPGDVEALVRQYAGAGFSPLVQVHARRTGECSLIYARPAGPDRIALLIFAHDGDDTTLINVVVNTDRLQETLAHPGHISAAFQ